MFRNIIRHHNLKHDCFEKPIEVIRVTEFNEEACFKFHKAVQLNRETGAEIIPVHIDSYGGSVYGVIGMMDMLKQAEEDGAAILTYVSSKAMSAGAALFSCGSEGYRFISPNAHIMVHQASSGAYGKVDDLKVSVDQSLKLSDRLLAVMSRNCGKQPDYFKRRLFSNGNADLFFDAKAAVAENLANFIGTPELKVEVTQRVTVSSSGSLYKKMIAHGHVAAPPLVE